MTNGENIIAILKPRKDQIRIIGNWVEVEIQKSGINFSCELDWWNAEYKEPTTKNDLGVPSELAKNSKKLENGTTKNDLGVQYRSLEDIKKLVESKADDLDGVMLDASGVIIGLYFAIANDLPSVTPIRPKGHWISHGEHCRNLGVIPSGLGAYEWCSNCDCGIDVKEWYRSSYNFCPNCGADMRGEE